jgi:hypothetical protein
LGVQRRSHDDDSLQQHHDAGTEHNYLAPKHA